MPWDSRHDLYLVLTHIFFVQSIGKQQRCKMNNLRFCKRINLLNRLSKYQHTKIKLCIVRPAKSRGCRNTAILFFVRFSNHREGNFIFFPATFNHSIIFWPKQSKRKLTSIFIFRSYWLGRTNVMRVAYWSPFHRWLLLESQRV